MLRKKTEQLFNVIKKIGTCGVNPASKFENVAGAWCLEIITF